MSATPCPPDSSQLSHVNKDCFKPALSFIEKKNLWVLAIIDCQCNIFDGTTHEPTLTFLDECYLPSCGVARSFHVEDDLIRNYLL